MMKISEVVLFIINLLRLGFLRGFFDDKFSSFLPYTMSKLYYNSSYRHMVLWKWFVKSTGRLIYWDSNDSVILTGLRFRARAGLV